MAFYNIYTMLNTLSKLILIWHLQIVIDSCCATFAEFQKRGKDFWTEFELYAADLLVGVVVDIALVGMLAPYARIGQPTMSRGLLGHIQHACAALPSRLVFACMLNNYTALLIVMNPFPFSIWSHLNCYF